MLDEEEIRQATLREVGEWLKDQLPDCDNPNEDIYPLARIYISIKAIDSLLQGQMPEGK